MRRRTFLARIGTASALTTSLAGCGRDGTRTETPLGENSIGMHTSGGSWYFDPIGLHVDPGETVTWVNISGQHSATAYEEGTSIAGTTLIPADAEGWDSGTLTTSGATYDHTFTVDGTYDYFCTPHKSLGMVGRVVVGTPGGPAEGRNPPDGDVPSSETIVEQASISYADFVQ